MSARTDGTHNLLDISMTVSRISQEMEYCAVMPDVESMQWKLYLSHIAFQPVHDIRLFPQTLFGDNQRRH